MKTHHTLGLATLVAAATLAMGCGSDDDDDGNQEAYSSCEETATTLASPDAVSALLGLSAEDLLAAAGGGFTVTASWAEDTSILTQAPLGGETELQVTIAWDGGEIREIESVPVEGENEMAADCRHRLEIDVTVTAATADGALDESWPGVLSQALSPEADGLDLPRLGAELDPLALDGDYEVVSIEGPAPDAVTGLFSSTVADPVAGTVDILVEQSSGDGEDGTVSQARHVALSWGDAR